MRVIKLYNVGDRVVLTDEWVKAKYEGFLKFNKAFGGLLTEEQKERYLKSLKFTKDYATGIVVQNTLTQQYVRYAVEWDRNDFDEKPPYAWFEEEDIKLSNE